MRKLGIAKSFSLYLICLLVSISSTAQSVFQHSYGTNANEAPMAFIQTTDKGFALLGSTDSSYGYLVKTDSLGNKMWSKRYSVTIAGSGERFIQANDKGYVIGSGNLLMKLDSLGDLQWVKNLGCSVSKLMQVNGGYILAGADINANAMFMKTDLSGNLLWTSNSLENSGDAVHDITQLDFDSCFYSITKNRIAKMDKNGNGIWSKYIYVNGSLEYGDNNKINCNPNGKQLDCFLTNGATNYWFVFDTSGAIKNPKSFQINSGYSSAAFCSSGNDKIFAYEVFDNSVGNTYNYHIYLFKADSAGNIKWARRIGGQQEDYPVEVLPTISGGIAVFGATQDFSAGAYDFYLIQTDSLGNSGCYQDTSSFNSLTSVSISLINDNIFNKIPNASDTSISVTAKVISDTSFNDCLCYTPHANFYYNQYMGYFSDSSTWANTWFWSFGDGTYDSATISPKHQYKDTGMYYVCLKVKNACGAVDSTCQWIDYQLPTVSINSIVNSNKTIVFPNPFTVTSTVQFSEIGVHYLELDDITGRKIRTMDCSDTQYQLQRNGLAQGVYLLRVFDGQRRYETSLKLVIE